MFPRTMSLGEQVSEEVSCYGTNLRQKVLTEQDVTVISAINYYNRLNEHQFGSSK